MYMAPEVQYWMWIKQKNKQHGLSKEMHEQINDALQTFKNSGILDKNGYDEKCDMWSIGIIAYSILSGGKHPFTHQDT